jgi:hypothetical protein
MPNFLIFSASTVHFVILKLPLDASTDLADGCQIVGAFGSVFVSNCIQSVLASGFDAALFYQSRRKLLQGTLTTIRLCCLRLSVTAL